MGFNNYSKFSNKSHEHTSKVNNDSAEINKLKGKVVNCDYLRVREKPSLESRELALIPKDLEFEIIDSNESDTFYKVLTPDGTEGYCMKDFISLV